MFKAKLIENDRYYLLRRRQMWFLFLPVAFYTIMDLILELPSWATFLFLGVYAAGFALKFTNHKQMGTLIGNRKLEVDGNEIRILSRKGDVQEVIPMADVDRILVLEDYRFPMETTGELIDEMKGEQIRNYLVIEQQGKERRLDFEPESYYMLTQLNKLKEHWKAVGYPVATL